MKKVLVVFGTRPEAIKMAPVIKCLESANGDFKTTICLTGQHRGMLDQVIAFFKIRPNFDLNIMKEGQDLFDITAGVTLGIKAVLREERPDIVLVQGDTTTTFATTLASYYEGIKVGHIEAGLRTKNLRVPFPEEGNRQLVSRLAQIHFAPTILNKDNLVAEGISAQNIFITGNTVVDAILWANEEVKKRAPHFYYENFGAARGCVGGEGPIILITGHRRESFGSGFDRICEALRIIAKQNPHVSLIYPVHPNPNVKGPVSEKLRDLKNIFLIDPLGYEPFVFLMNRAELILTDSGGIQEEAPSLGKPVLVLRDLTERQEAIDSGIISLVGTNVEKIVAETERLLNDREFYQKISKLKNPFGDGNAAARIVNILKDY
jgi:UDP-N-acetylglucosamine 2-epimerase (non-hydrolysing)